MLSVTAVTRPDGDIALIVQTKIVNWLQEMMQMLLLVLDLEGRGEAILGAGWTAYFASGAGTCSANGGKFKRAWISVANGNRAGK